MHRLARVCTVAQRSYATSAPKASMKLVAELRRATNVPLTKAAEALAACNNDFDAAVAWLDEEMKRTGAARAAKLAGRAANDGTIGLSVLSDGTRGTGVRAALIELACETDFVSRGELFSKLAGDIAHTAAFFAEASGPSPSFAPLPLDAFGDAPCLGPDGSPSTAGRTVTDAIRDAVAKVGENVSLRRAVAVVAEPSDTGISLGSYVHGSTPGFPSLGRMACLTMVHLRTPKTHILQDENFLKPYSVLRRALARQIVGMNVETLRGAQPVQEPDPSSTALYDQPFAMLPGAAEGETVEQSLRSWGKQWDADVEVRDFIKWTRSETEAA
ncbi:hypothetical protein EXIGLDRAFT_721329 [Exidia glandulosa HHB12029]|uniref:Elongation factor Ts, mitochondrial n=1 Tax=Exidia glandulosa HHB12029 TaxID=1314781 RepID=A0A165NCR9_EXIGL|nr:hypothetical protein EXIGLDRAFT_721329 [Exidia glandulosa HHB12029]